MFGGAERANRGTNIRDAAMADNVEWILDREERIVIGAANGHIQHLARSLGEAIMVIATTNNGGRMFLHRPIPDDPPGHTEVFFDDIGPFEEPDSLDALLASTGESLALTPWHTFIDPANPRA
ncbi:hypothetical protein F4560_003073 [Saccharothrix ecbatanensis]|uniref:Uncharacterized protein n=1 Tax=Saccharothrix ecbatanensis TaxID=1105145 RepID=A0A7W9M0V0_9PSEU|nr:hypothetical protein [Saccharothrix ecbatanensis]